MPAIRFNKTFKVIGRVKAFLNLEVGATRGRVPDAKQLGVLVERVEEQRAMLGRKEREITKLKLRLSTMTESSRHDPTAVGTRGAADEPGVGALPEFVIIGAQKCGTTFLYHLLCHHPNVEPALAKEVHYFDTHFDKGIEWYRSRFPSPTRKGGRRAMSGESSPYYLYHPHAAKRAAQVVPKAKLIALVRDPVDRAYSDYNHKVREGRETLSFEEAVEAEPERLRGEREKMLADEGYHSPNYRKYSYLSRGIYVDQLKEWRRFFAEGQLLVLKSEDFFQDPQGCFEHVLDFLGLPGGETGASGERNEGDYPPMNPATRRRLEEFFEPHNRRLYEYLGVDFGW